jgi:hypothetical protein
MRRQTFRRRSFQQLRFWRPKRILLWARVFSSLLSSLERRAVRYAQNPRQLGAEIGFFSVLHTWNQRLQHHPHVHSVAAAGGLALDHTHWIRSRHSFFLPVTVLNRIFRGKFVAGLKTAFHQD